MREVGQGQAAPLSTPRERLLRAMTEVAAQRGYGGASVARVIEAAVVSRTTFYEHFGGREDSKQTLNGEVASCPSLRDELLAWAGTHSLPPGRAAPRRRRVDGAVA